VSIAHIAIGEGANRNTRGRVRSPDNRSSLAFRSLIELCHHHNVLVSTGGFLEHVLAQGSDAVRQHVAECQRLGFDIVEISAGFIAISTDD
jgi:phosphosulfolactate synthase (CoM biosynthesis protein A)